MSKPGEGASLTTGEAAAYARGRAAGLREAADAIQCSGCGSVAAVLALLDGAAAGDVDLTRGLAVAAEEAQVERDLARQERDAARARVAELEREVEDQRQAAKERREHFNAVVSAHAKEAARSFARGAEAMREAAAREVMRVSCALLDQWRAGLKADTHLEGQADAGDTYEDAIRALPLPQDAGDE